MTITVIKTDTVKRHKRKLKCPACGRYTDEYGKINGEFVYMHEGIDVTVRREGTRTVAGFFCGMEELNPVVG